MRASGACLAPQGAACAAAGSTTRAATDAVAAEPRAALTSTGAPDVCAAGPSTSPAATGASAMGPRGASTSEAPPGACSAACPESDAARTGAASSVCSATYPTRRRRTRRPTSTTPRTTWVMRTSEIPTPTTHRGTSRTRTPRTQTPRTMSSSRRSRSAESAGASVNPVVRPSRAGRRRAFAASPRGMPSRDVCPVSCPMRRAASLTAGGGDERVLVAPSFAPASPTLPVITAHVTLASPRAARFPRCPARGRSRRSAWPRSRSSR